MHKDRIKIATALGYYARATDPEAATLSKAIELHGLVEYRHDIDCQVAFRQGWQKAEEHIEMQGFEAEEIKKLVASLKDFMDEVRAARIEVRQCLFDISAKRHAPMSAEAKIVPIPEGSTLIDPQSWIKNKVDLQAAKTAAQTAEKIKGKWMGEALRMQAAEAEAAAFEAVRKARETGKLAVIDYDSGTFEIIGGGGAAPDDDDF